MLNNDVILPPATIGIIGGGQLGQMLALSAKSMGYKVGILDPTPDAPAAQVSDFQIVAAYEDQAAMDELIQRCDVLTYEFENVATTTLKSLSSRQLPQGVDLLAITSDRLNEKNFLRQHQLPTVAFAAVNDDHSFEAAVRSVGLPAILKTTSGGYDGHGQVDINTARDYAAAQELYTQTPCILEARLDFTKEVSVMVTRTVTGNVRVFPLSENQHSAHILHRSIVPARVSSEIVQQVVQAATTIAKGLELRGVLGIEFFVTEANQLVVNELAPRPHNSGHYSIEACNVSQFEAHIRSICGLPIPEIRQIQPAVMFNLLGEELSLARQQLPQHPEWHFHDYGKAEIRPQRKLGHVTILGPELSPLITAALAFEKQDKGVPNVD
ncbi:5-(carboxyamino)imidazole ribonucleotide synthase [Lactobacillus sp. CC-MHH1034]|uniref:5-(carboxyamino)imidazole ribonucleotide synthase n=1 Tax=Agrilactobacillus fermenti TaxID=2586909 RepID=UPI001E35BBF9|nr:5-(carboxyamino)imidazole ribonucleotide synthase [Agrilactobacillus fermenti]MCD2255889.1 5-(carboxyamino)imidazole ribonucleotide synthase [Agrilactobacillus fermenti]